MKSLGEELTLYAILTPMNIITEIYQSDTI